jgi:hypothetical protein
VVDHEQLDGGEEVRRPRAALLELRGEACVARRDVVKYGNEGERRNETRALGSAAKVKRDFQRETPLERLLFRFGLVVALFAFCRLGPIGNTKFGHTQPVRLIRL